MRIAVGSDHAGFELKDRLVRYLKARQDVEVIDLGPASADRCDYPDYAADVARTVQGVAADRGLLVCGSGIGVSIVANRFAGIRAALVQDAVMARLSREHNDANVLCLGSRLIEENHAVDALDTFLKTEFEGGRHAGRLAKIDALET